MTEKEALLACINMWAIMKSLDPREFAPEETIDDAKAYCCDVLNVNWTGDCALCSYTDSVETCDLPGCLGCPLIGKWGGLYRPECVAEGAYYMNADNMWNLKCFEAYQIECQNIINACVERLKELAD